MVAKTQNPVKEEVFYLTSEESGVTGTDISTGQTSLWLQGWRFQVPVGQSLILLPSDTFSIYGEDQTDTELTVADKLRIRVEDPSHADSKLVLGPAIYDQVKEFQDRDLIKHLDLVKPLIVKENSWIIIEVYAAVSLDESDCHWILTCQRVRHAIF